MNYSTRKTVFCTKSAYNKTLELDKILSCLTIFILTSRTVFVSHCCILKLIGLKNQLIRLQKISSVVIFCYLCIYFSYRNNLARIMFPIFKRRLGFERVDARGPGFNRHTIPVTKKPIWLPTISLLGFVAAQSPASVLIDQCMKRGSISENCWTWDHCPNKNFQTTHLQCSTNFKINLTMCVAPLASYRKHVQSYEEK